MKFRPNENFFAALFAVLVACLIAFGPVSSDLYLADVLALKLMYVAALLGSSMGLLYFLRGTSCDILKEVFEEHNVGAALLVTGFLVAIAIAVSG